MTATGDGLRFTARSESRRVDVSLDVRPGETVALLGPNGAGKSTVLALIAGLLRADEGRGILNDRVLFDRGTGAARAAADLPPHRRGVALLAQDALLFPHLSVLDNVAFGPRSAGVSRARSRAAAREWLDRVDASTLASRLPGQLSGGQAQRVAVARALAADPDLLLLDEPLAALDVSIAGSIRRLLRTVLADRTALIVTHDVMDALTLADRVIVLENGRIVEQGDTRDVVERPRTPFTARLAGLNFFAGERRGNVLHTAGGLAIPLQDAPADASAWVAVIRPDAVSVSPAPDARASQSTPAPAPTPAQPIIRTILDIEPHGDNLRVRARDIAADLSPATLIALGLDVGDEAAFTLDPTAVRCYPLDRKARPADNDSSVA